MINVTADTSKFTEALYSARRSLDRHRSTPDWEARLWSLTEKLAVKMSDRCQEGLVGPEEFARTVYAMASWTVSVAMTRGAKKPTQEELMKEIEKAFGVKAQ